MRPLPSRAGACSKGPGQLKRLYQRPHWLGPDHEEHVFRIFVLVMAALGSIGALARWVVPHPWTSWLAMDYRTFYEASRTAVDALYDGPIFVYPPTGIFLTRLLSFLDYWPGFVILGALSALALFVTVPDKKVAGLSLLSLPALQGLLWGQFSMLFAAGLFLALTLQPFRRGLLIGVLLSIKPQLFLAAPVVFLIRRDHETVAGIVVGGLLSVAIATLMFGFQPWLGWFEAVSRFRDFLTLTEAHGGLITPGGIAERWGLPVTPFWLAGVILSGWLVTRESDEIPALAAIIGGASLMASPYGMVHDAVILIPAAAACLLAGKKVVPSLIVFCAAYLAFVVPVFLLGANVHAAGAARIERAGAGRAERAV